MQKIPFLLQDSTISPFSTWDINPTAKKTKNARRRKETTDDDTGGSPVPKKPGRKQVLTAPISKRQMQNREAQRVFRERKTRQQQELLDRIKDLEKLYGQSQQENRQLKDVVETLKRETEELQFTLKTFKAHPKEDPGKIEFSALGTNYFGIPNTSPSPPASVASDSGSVIHSAVEFRDVRSSSLMSIANSECDSADLKSLPKLSSMFSLSQPEVNSRGINLYVEQGAANANEVILSPLVSYDSSVSPAPVTITPQKADIIVKQEAEGSSDTCNFQSSMLSLNENAGDLSIEYVDLLVEELHELCKEMKQKAMVSSEPFEFEWPCDEINNRLSEVNSYGQA